MFRSQADKIGCPCETREFDGIIILSDKKKSRETRDVHPRRVSERSRIKGGVVQGKTTPS